MRKPPFFSTLGAKFEGKEILDFGGGTGIFLDFRPDIDPRLYTCIEVNAKRVEEGKRQYPLANWSWYNRHNSVWNPYGIKGLLPNIDKKFDIAIAYGVFSNTTVEDMFELLGWMYSKLKVKGEVWFSFCNSKKETCVNHFIYEEERIANVGVCEDPRTDTYSYLCDSKILSKPDKKHRYVNTFYDENYLLGILKNYKPMLLRSPHHPQDCIMIKKEETSS